MGQNIGLQNINHLQHVSVCLYICVCARTGLGAKYLEKG